MKTRILFSLLFGALLLSAPAASLRMFSDVDAAVQNARASNRLLLFVLLNPESDASAAVAKMLNDNSLELSPDEFVVVTCSAGEAAHDKLFQERFKQDVSAAPIVVISDPSGNLLSSLAGANDKPAYDKIVMDALIKAGMREAPREMVVSSDDDALDGVSKIFRLLKEDLSEKVVITEYRVWTLKNEEKVEAALLEARGDHGIFRKEDGSGDVKIFFNDLSEEDVAFLQKVLSS